MCFKNIDTSHKLYPTLVSVFWSRIHPLLQQLTMMINRLLDRLIKMQKKIKLIAVAVLSAVGLSTTLAQTDSYDPLLTVKEIMNGLITPTTTTIWGAYQLESDAQWQEVRNAALSVIAAGNLLQLGGSGEGESAMAAEADWRIYNLQMIDAARQVIVATNNKDEEALSAAGNDALYPPCESCHQQYQVR